MTVSFNYKENPVKYLFLSFKKSFKKFGSGGIRTHAPEETGALNQRLRPLGHATSMWFESQGFQRALLFCPFHLTFYIVFVESWAFPLDW